MLTMLVSGQSNGKCRIMTRQRCDSPSSHTVVNGLPGQRRYIEAGRKDAAADRCALHKRYVVDPYWADCAAGGELESFASMRGLAPILNLDALEAAIRQLEDHDLSGLLGGVFSRISAILPSPRTTVWVLAGDPDDKFTVGLAGGVNGTTAGSGKIWLHLIPMAGWLDRLPGALAHEHHHSVWLARHYKGVESQTLLNYLVMEGQACMFSGLLSPSIRSPWTHALTGEQERDVWTKMQPHLGSSSHQVMAAFMFGGVNGLPPFCGYTIGYRIMEAYLKRHGDADMRDWTDLDAGTLLSQSAYGSQF